MRILIIGASGLVGSNCLEHFGQLGWQVLGTHHSYAAAGTQPLDLFAGSAAEQAAYVRGLLGGQVPSVVVHCGALTHVDLAEQQPAESQRMTVQSTARALALAGALAARMVYIGTDYVFDGARGPYVETDAVNPLSVYARHKLEAEQLVLGQPNSLVLRITNVYGKEERNKNFVMRIVQQLQAGQPLTLKLPVDQYATPVNALDVARAMALLLQDGRSGLYHIASTDWVNRCQLAARIGLYFTGHKMAIVPMTTAELQQPAQRPLLGGLIAKKFLDQYPDFVFTNVDDFLRQTLAHP